MLCTILPCKNKTHVSHCLSTLTMCGTARIIVILSPCFFMQVGKYFQFIHLFPTSGRAFLHPSVCTLTVTISAFITICRGVSGNIFPNILQHMSIISIKINNSHLNSVSGHVMRSTVTRTQWSISWWTPGSIGWGWGRASVKPLVLINLQAGRKAGCTGSWHCVFPAVGTLPDVITSLEIVTPLLNEPENQRLNEFRQTLHVSVQLDLTSYSRQWTCPLCTHTWTWLVSLYFYVIIKLWQATHKLV